MNRLLFFSIGFGVWLAATIVFRLAGQHFFLIDNTPVMLGLYGVTLIGILAIALGLFRWQQLDSNQRYQAALLLAMPGMFLDVLSVQYFETIFPNLELAANAPFGAWLLWAYGLVVASPFVVPE